MTSMRLLPLLVCMSLPALAAAPAPLKLSQSGQTLTMRQGDRVLWTQPLRGGPYAGRSSVLGPQIAPLNVLGRVAYAVYCWEGQRLYCQTAGFDKRTGEALFDLPGTPQASGQGQLLTNFWVTPTDTSFDTVDGFRVDLLTGKAERVGFRIPPRPGCGELNYSVGLPGRTTSGPRYVDAEQDDDCGVFVARFDWHGPVAQKPVLNVLGTRPLKR